jgi:hypothetical protein
MQRAKTVFLIKRLVIVIIASQRLQNPREQEETDVVTIIIIDTK